MNSHANILIINGSEKLLSHEQRILGFRDTITRKYPDISILDIQTCNDDKFQAYNLLRQKLDQYPQTDMIYVVGEGITGVCAAIREYASREVKVICFDDVPHTLKLFKEGRVHATVCQQPFQQGYSAIQTCYRALAGMETEEYIILDQIIKIGESFD